MVWHYEKCSSLLGGSNPILPLFVVERRVDGGRTQENKQSSEAWEEWHHVVASWRNQAGGDQESQKTEQSHRTERAFGLELGGHRMSYVWVLLGMVRI